MGTEIYQIDRARWNLYRDEEDGRMNWWIHVDSSAAIRQHEDTAYTKVEPSWELNLLDPAIAISPGFRAEIPNGLDESRGGWITNFYANNHNGSDRNTIEVVAVDGDRVRLRLYGEVIDPNYYDGSKPPARLRVDSWFDKDPEGARSMQ